MYTIYNVYQILNVRTGYCYVGISRKLKERWSSHLSGLRGNKHPIRQMQLHWNGGSPKDFKFQVIERVRSRKEALEREGYYMKKLKKVYNKPERKVKNKRIMQWIEFPNPLDYDAIIKIAEIEKRSVKRQLEFVVSEYLKSHKG